MHVSSCMYMDSISSCTLRRLSMAQIDRVEAAKFGKICAKCASSSQALVDKDGLGLTSESIIYMLISVKAFCHLIKHMCTSQLLF